MEISKTQLKKMKKMLKLAKMVKFKDKNKEKERIEMIKKAEENMKKFEEVANERKI